MQTIEIERLRQVWEKVCGDQDGRRALAKLARDSFDLRRLSPQDATLRHPNWADYIAALPFLPTRPTRRQVHLATELRKHRALIPALRRLALKMNDPFCEVVVVRFRPFRLTCALS